jgi:hypothetical protein
MEALLLVQVRHGLTKCAVSADLARRRSHRVPSHRRAEAISASSDKALSFLTAQLPSPRE